MREGLVASPTGRIRRIINPDLEVLVGRVEKVAVLGELARIDGEIRMDDHIGRGAGNHVLDRGQYELHVIGPEYQPES